MVHVRHQKLHRLHDILPEQLVVDSAWLIRHGYSRALRNKYVAHGWLDQVSRGVFRRPVAGLGRAQRPPLEPTWENVVLSLQHLMNAGVSVGGRTALDLQGFAHYLPAGSPREIHLYASEKLPVWLKAVPVSVRWVVHNPDRLFAQGGRQLTSPSVDTETGARTSKDPIHGDNDFTSVDIASSRWPMTVSTPERAVLEMIDEVPTRESFEQADAMMDGLHTLSPRRLQKLLEDCRSVKTKRLFLWLAKRHNHAWLKRIDVARLALGHGKRVLVKGGRLDPTYNITVPKTLAERDGI